MITELFLQSSRASAFSVLGFFQWFLIMVISIVFISIEVSDLAGKCGWVGVNGPNQ